MAFADSGRAIGAVTRLLQDHLIRRGFEVSIGRPEAAAANNATAKLNLFLFETAFDAQLRNHNLRVGEAPPLWLVLRYLLTAFDVDEDSDSAAAHELLGRGLSALHDINVLALDALVAPDVRLALEHNPEPLKLSFEESGAELLSKLMQGGDERYRLSVAFQMRPVMIVPGSEPRAALLVGVDYSTTPQTVIGQDGVVIDVIPSLGPVLQRVEPARFEVGERITIFGRDIAAAEIEAVLGGVVLRTVERRIDRLVVDVEGSPGTPIADGAALSAGERPLTVQRRLSPTRVRSSNLLAARLLPSVDTVTLVGGNLRVDGHLLGNDADDIVVVLARSSDGNAVRLFDVVTPQADQQTLRVPGVAAAVAAGTYRVILRVNDQQARGSPEVTLP
jgi:hypothetical protein